MSTMLFFSIITAVVPRVPDEERIDMVEINPLRRVTTRFGNLEEPNAPHGLALCRKLGWQFDIMSTSFLLSRRALRPAASSAIPVWQRALFFFLSRNATNASDYFHIPAGRVVEIAQVNL